MSKKKSIGIIVGCTIAIIAAIVLISVKPWERTYTLSVSVSPPGAGFVSPPGGEYESGMQVTLTASSAGAYRFANWTGDVDTVANVNAAATTITMNSHYSVTANFAQRESIRSWYDLDTIRDNLAGNYILMNSLDSATVGYEEVASPRANGGKGWQPVAVLDDAFIGTFDGQEHEIRDLHINRPDEDAVGLFGCVGLGGVIRDIRVVSSTVTGYENVGGLVGFHMGTVSDSYCDASVTGHMVIGGLTGINWGTVSNCYCSSDVTGDEELGGLVGGNFRTVIDSYATGSVTGKSTIIYGGLVGLNMGTVGNSYATGNVIGGAMVGGLVGANREGSVSNSYSSGSVTGEWSYVGGLAGYNNDAVSNCYSTGGVIGSWYVGGLVGGNDGGTVGNSYSSGNVTGDADVGGLVGANNGTFSNSFWDTETSRQATSAGGMGKTTTQMKNIATFSAAAWNITAVANPSTRNTSYVWNIVDGQTYPFLSWQSAS